MRVYSDHLDANDLRAAVVGIPHVFLARLEIIERTRLRSHGWNVQLGSSTSNRWRNSGRFGAMTWQDCAPASWDQHGKWIAELFALDPDAVIGPYRGHADFNSQTERRYAAPA